MYLAEVLNKLPVVQHFYFGSILSYDGPRLPSSTANSEDMHYGHSHGPGPGLSGWTQDCCGIPVPSAFGAARVMGQGLSGTGIRPVPFD